MDGLSLIFFQFGDAGAKEFEKKNTKPVVSTCWLGPCRMEHGLLAASAFASYGWHFLVGKHLNHD